MGKFLFALLLGVSSASASGPAFHVKTDLTYEQGLALAIDPVVDLLKTSYIEVFANLEMRSEFQARTRYGLTVLTLTNIEIAADMLRSPLTYGFEPIERDLERRLRELPPVRTPGGKLNIEYQEAIENQNLHNTYLLDRYDEWLLDVQSKFAQDPFALGLAEGLNLPTRILTEKVELPVEIPFLTSPQASWNHRLAMITALHQLIERELYRRTVKSVSLYEAFDNASLAIEEAQAAIKRGHFKQGDSLIQKMALELSQALAVSLAQLNSESQCRKTFLREE